MGLDMWLRAKTKSRNYTGNGTGACGGMFGCAPDDEGMIEIGYWRKAYAQDELISNFLERPTTASATSSDDDINCKNIKIRTDAIDTIIAEAQHILATHHFSPDGEEDPDDDYGTWMCKGKWEDTVKFFTEAKKILADDPSAEFYYCIWY